MSQAEMLLLSVLTVSVLLRLTMLTTNLLRWSEQARAQKKKYDEGAITLEDFQRWLKES